MNKELYTCVVALLCIAVLSLSVETSAGDATEDAANIGFHLLEEPVNPRFIAMGFTGGALAGKGFAFYNPALPFLVGQSYLTAEYGVYPKADLKHTQLETVLSLENWFIGLSLHSESIDNIYETNFFGNLPYYDVPFSAQFTNISLVTGFKQGEVFAVAVAVNGMQDRIHDFSAYAISFSAGAVVMPIPERLTLGLSVLNVGFSTPMLGADSGSVWGDGEKLPLNARLGIAWTDRFKNMPYTAALDVVYRNVRDRNDRFTKHIRDRFTVPLGFELWPLPPLAIRMGKRINFPTEIINFGIGLKLDPLTVDASFVIPRLVDDSELKWLTGITWYLKSAHKKKPERKKTVDKPPMVSPQETVSDSATPTPDTLSPDSGQAPLKPVDTTQTTPAEDDSTETATKEIDRDSLPEEGVLPEDSEPDTVHTPAETPGQKDSLAPSDALRTKPVPAGETTGAPVEEPDQPEPVTLPDEPIKKPSPPAEKPGEPSEIHLDTIPRQ